MNDHEAAKANFKKIRVLLSATFEFCVAAFCLWMVFESWPHAWMVSHDRPSDPDFPKAIGLWRFSLVFFAFWGVIALLFFARSVREIRRLSKQ
jgi:hypothetical protein